MSIPVLWCLGFGGLLLGAPAASLDNAVLRVDLRDQALVVTDKRNGAVWEQVNVETDPARYSQRLISADGGKLVLAVAMRGQHRAVREAPVAFRLTVALAADRPEIALRFEAEDQGEWREARYPYAFRLDTPDAALLYPHAEGLLVPARRDAPDFFALPKPGQTTINGTAGAAAPQTQCALPDGELLGGVRAYLPCVGQFDGPTGRGLLTVWETLEPAAVHWPGAAAVAPQIAWLANKYRWDRPFDARLLFADRGGYVALAKLYRAWFAAQGRHKTLRQKAAENPLTDALAGAPIYWAYGRAEDVTHVADALKADGLDRLLLHVATHPDPLVKPVSDEQRAAYQEAVRHAKSLGYVVSHYDQVRDAFKRDETGQRWHQINTDAYPDAIVRLENGQLLGAFGKDSGVVCPSLTMGFARRHIPTDLATYGYTGRFMDCFGSCGFGEGICWSAEHPSDRYVCRRTREEVLAYVNSLGQLTGTECGVDYLIPSCHWFEGTTTLVTWVANPCPGDPAFSVSQSTRYRIPFYALVHHDEVVTTWRWEDGMNAPADQWQRKNLWTVLDGAVPMYRIAAVKTFDALRPRIAATQRYLGDWTRQVAYDELLSHRFVTADHSVQESVFSSGVGVVVNFGPQPATLPDGQALAAQSYLTFTDSQPRRYSPPPGAFP